MLRSLLFSIGEIGIKRVGLSKKGSVKVYNWTERVIIIEI